MRETYDYMETLEALGLPEELFWFEMGGQKLFHIYGTSGGVSASQVAYLMEKGIGHPTLDGKDLGLPGEVRDYGCGWKFLCV